MCTCDDVIRCCILFSSRIVCGRACAYGRCACVLFVLSFSFSIRLILSSISFSLFFIAPFSLSTATIRLIEISSSLILCASSFSLCGVCDLVFSSPPSPSFSFSSFSSPIACVLVVLLPPWVSVFTASIILASSLLSPWTSVCAALLLTCAAGVSFLWFWAAWGAHGPLSLQHPLQRL